VIAIGLAITHAITDFCSGLIQDFGIIHLTFIRG
jgi:hypothetical protein